MKNLYSLFAQIQQSATVSSAATDPHAFQAEKFAAVGARWHEIRVPERRGTPVLDAPRKPFSQRYWDLLSTESGAPMWPEESQLEAAPRQPPQQTEFLGKTLDFTIQTWKTGALLTMHAAV